jgi:threonine/homoserine efflux transporter RhtA
MSMEPGPQDALTPPGHASMVLQTGVGWPLPAAMVLSGIVSVQAGAGIVARLFCEIPPAAVTGLRLWTSAVAIAVVAGRRLARAFGDLANPAMFAGYDRALPVLVMIDVRGK